MSQFGLLSSILSIFELFNFPRLRFYLFVENVNMFFSLSTEGKGSDVGSTQLPGLRPGRTVGENLLGNQILQTSINNPQQICNDGVGEVLLTWSSMRKLISLLESVVAVMENWGLREEQRVAKFSDISLSSPGPCGGKQEGEREELKADGNN